VTSPLEQLVVKTLPRTMVVGGGVGRLRARAASGQIYGSTHVGHGAPSRSRQPTCTHGGVLSRLPRGSSLCVNVNRILPWLTCMHPRCRTSWSMHSPTLTVSWIYSFGLVSQQRRPWTRGGSVAQIPGDAPCGPCGTQTRWSRRQRAAWQRVTPAGIPIPCLCGCIRMRATPGARAPSCASALSARAIERAGTSQMLQPRLHGNRRAGRSTGPQVHRCAGVTLDITASTCMPHPLQVVFPQRPQRAGLHI